MKFKCKDIVRIKIENISPNQSLFSSPFDASNEIGIIVEFNKNQNAYLVLTPDYWEPFNVNNMLYGFVNEEDMEILTDEIISKYNLRKKYPLNIDFKDICLDINRNFSTFYWMFPLIQRRFRLYNKELGKYSYLDCSSERNEYYNKLDRLKTNDLVVFKNRVDGKYLLGLFQSGGRYERNNIVWVKENNTYRWCSVNLTDIMPIDKNRLATNPFEDFDETLVKSFDNYKFIYTTDFLIQQDKLDDIFAYNGLLVDAIIYPDNYKKTDMYQYQKYYELKKAKLEEIYEFFNSIRVDKSESLD